MPAPQRTENEPADENATDQPMTREQWLAYHVSRAPIISPQQWADTLLLLHNRHRDDNENEDEQKAS